MSGPGEVKKKTKSEEDTAQAQYRADAGKPAMRGPDEIRRPVSLASREQQGPVQDAWWS
jgi:hypothetical protein